LIGRSSRGNFYGEKGRLIRRRPRTRGVRKEKSARDQTLEKASSKEGGQNRRLYLKEPRGRSPPLERRETSLCLILFSGKRREYFFISFQKPLCEGKSY